jgi:hypothetical protein
MTEAPIEELLAGNGFRQTMMPRADDKKNLMWHGWVIMDAFLAGIQWERKRAAIAKADPPESNQGRGAP